MPPPATLITPPPATRPSVSCSSTTPVVATRVDGLANAEAEPYGAGIPVGATCNHKQNSDARSGGANREAMIDRSFAALP